MPQRISLMVGKLAWLELTAAVNPLYSACLKASWKLKPAVSFPQRISGGLCRAGVFRRQPGYADSGFCFSSRQKNAQICWKCLETAAAELAAIHERLNIIGAASAEARAAEILHGLGFAPDDLARKVCEFSGGWRMRLAFGRGVVPSVRYFAVG